jgi:CheY-like chemotaxis protein
MRVLIVEDDLSIADMLNECLRDEGYHTVTARHGQEALDYLHNETLPDLILLDVAMPVMNGWEFLTQREQFPHLAPIPVIMLTAVREVDYRTEHWPHVRRVAKPVDIFTLLTLVAEYQSP